MLFANIGLYAWFQMAANSASKPVGSDRQSVQTQGAPIQLVREVATDQLKPIREKRKPERKGAPPASEGTLCTLLGPFTEEYQGLNIVERLAALQVDGRLREIEMQGQMRYWVFLAPLGSKREAFNKLRELQAAGVDSYVIPKGSLTNGISFGIFSERARAESLKRKLRQQGIDAQSREEPETYLERWVVLSPGAAAGLAESFWAQLQSEYPELDRRQNLCSEVIDD